ncbi:MAG TPA: PIN domain-containing protein [Candidatus Saccharimonadales bacterium]|nr:PIN domain-containing protein [Candidatus Saccharimonadales bacterium]
MIVLDTNIVLEILEKRHHLQAVLDLLGQHSKELIAVTTLTLSNVFYVAEKSQAATIAAEELLKNYVIIDVTSADADWAFKNYDHKDFEDALQVAAAKRSGAKLFMTIDGPLTSKYQSFLPIQLVK